MLSNFPTFKEGPSGDVEFNNQNFSQYRPFFARLVFMNMIISYKVDILFFVNSDTDGHNLGTTCRIFDTFLSFIMEL